MNESSPPRSSRSDYTILVAGIALAVILWIAWLFFGIRFVHGVVLSQAAQTLQPAASQPLSANSPDCTTQSSVSDRNALFGEFGQAGDSFGGLNTLLTAIAGSFVLWAGILQHKTLKHAREEAQNDRAHRQVLEFESLFFRLLELTSTAAERIEAANKNANNGNSPEKYHGARALDSLAWKICNSIGAERGNFADPRELRDALVKSYLIDVYRHQPSAFGPYLRLLFQTFKFVAESKLPEPQQVRYANLARGQISEGTVLLIALNGLTPNGFDFIPLIEKFGLLEHLHPRYRRECGSALETAYRQRAFLGSQGRSTPENVWICSPILERSTYENLVDLAYNHDAFDSGFHGAESTQGR